MDKKELTLPNIFTCIVLDGIGMASYIVPALGEFIDVGWAFISALLFNSLFGGKVGRIGSILNFLEEALPFTDIIPSFTIAWFIRKNEIDKMLKQKMN